MPSTFPSRWVITPANNADDIDVFPTLKGAGFLALKTPVWSTKIDMSISGIERRRALWSYPLWKFKIGYEYIRDDSVNLELQRIITFFNSKAGSTQAFFFLDSNDNSVTAMNFGTGNGTNKVFQLSRTITIGGITFTEPVRGFNGTPTIYINGGSTAAFTIGSQGVITFTTAPANGAALTWTGSFLYLCRFSKDELNIAQLAGGIWNSGGIEFQTAKQ